MDESTVDMLNGLLWYPVMDAPFPLSSVHQSQLLKRRLVNMSSKKDTTNYLVSENGINGIIENVDQEVIQRDLLRSQLENDSSRDTSPIQSLDGSSLTAHVPLQTFDSEQDDRLDTLLNMGYILYRENGQRKFCAPPEWNLPVPPRGSEVFVGKLPRDVCETELAPLFGCCGQIYELRLMMNFSGTNRGYAFITYTNREDARRACQKLNNYEIRRGHYIGVVVSVDNCRLFVGGIPRNRTREEVKTEMSKLTDGVVDAILYPSASDKSRNRGFAFVEYESHKAAAKARRKLIPNRIQLWGNVIAVDWAEPEPDVDESTMATVRVLYVRNLMVNTTEDTLRQVFEGAAGISGCVERVKKMRDYAFVHFTTRELALRAMDKLNGMDLEGAIIEVTLSKPPYQSNIVRCMKNLQKSSGRKNGVQAALGITNDDMRQIYFNPNPALINNVLTAAAAASVGMPSAVVVDPAIIPTPQSVFNVQTAAALTGFPCIDPYTNTTQNLLERQNSCNGQIGNTSSLKLLTNGPLQHSNGISPLIGGRINRGAAGMCSAGFQAFINNSLRHTANNRRKFSEQFILDYVISQQHHQQQQIQQASSTGQTPQPLANPQQPLFSPPTGMVILPNGAGLPVWYPAVATPTTGGYVPLIPATPLSIPLPQTASAAVSELNASIPVSVPATVTTVASSDELSLPVAQQQTQQGHQLGTSVTLIPGGHLLINGGAGPVPFANYQQALDDYCREQAYGTTQLERTTTLQQKDASGRELVFFNYKA